VSALSQRLRKLEVGRGLGAPALPPLVYDLLDANGLSSGTYLIAGERYGEFQRATGTEVAAFMTARQLRLTTARRGR
jgi:hypothetical protein